MNKVEMNEQAHGVKFLKYGIEYIIDMNVNKENKGREPVLKDKLEKK